MLDLIEHIAATAAARILIVCLARGDLLERRSGWAAAGGRGSIIRLEPLSDTDSARLLGRLATRRHAKVRREEVMYAAEGNPLFLEQLVAMRADDAGVRTPPTIQALLAARIDALPVPERRVIEAASIEGRGFHRGAAQALVDEARSVDAALAALVDRELIRPARSELSGETGFRFTHILVRDAAYDLLPKRRRADLHVAYAEWLLGRVDRGSAADEMVGYHLEQAYEYRSQLGRTGDDRHQELAARASAHLSDAGRRALASGDRGGASNLLERAVALRARADPHRAALLIDLGGVHREQGRFRESEAALREARALAVDARDSALQARVQVARLRVAAPGRPGRRRSSHAPPGRRPGAALDAAGDHSGLAHLWHVRALIWWIKCQSGEAERAWRRAAEEARRAGDNRLASDAVGWEATSMAVGPTPVDAAIARCEEIRLVLEGDPWAEALALQPLASLHAMRGEFSRAFELLDESSSALAGFGPTVDAAVSYPEVFVAMLAGDLERAERHLRTGRRILEQMGERAVLASTEGYLAQVVLAAGRETEADRLARRCAALATADDAWPQAAWRQVRARVLAARGQSGRALDLAQDAVEITMATDHPNLQADSIVDLALVFEAAGSREDAATAAATALGIYEAKGNVVRARETRKLLARPVSV